jgi:hypothetical protein
MKRRIGFSAILILLAVTAGCPYTAKVSLGDPDRNSFDKRLVGTWLGYDAGDVSDSTLIRVIPFNDAEYYVEMDEQDEEPSRYRVFILTIGGQKFLQFNELAGGGAAPEYCFARYAFSENGDLSLRFVGEEIVPKTLATDPAALKAFMAAHLGDSALDDKDMKLILRPERP